VLNSAASPAWTVSSRSPSDKRTRPDQTEQMWSGNPNGTLVNEVSGLPPGRALEVGAGEGGDALWLAEQGWTVTANDISQRALDRVSTEAERRGLRVHCHHADANALSAGPAIRVDGEVDVCRFN
jgi:2-polyprenyl-3-methyl-5-hydroxy-6-metoxy-1,4-benzoquinol methylase